MKRQSGFTLVEIAIVLVIIGLLLGGVLKGQELINSAKVKNFASDIRNISTLIYAYQDQLPGTAGRRPQCCRPCGRNGTANGTLCSAPNASPCPGNARINGALERDNRD